MSTGAAKAAGERHCFLSGICPDERCETKLYFPSYDSSVECTNCGQRHPRQALKSVAEVTDPDVALHNMVRNLLMGNFAPKKTTDSVKVLGLSNYQCKLLSPLLTYYGMDKQGQPQPLNTLTQNDVFDCGTLRDRAFLIQPEHVDVMGYGRDQTGSGRYLQNTLDQIRAANGDQEVLIPIHADGDGHCLVHGISRALVGRELFWHALRTNLRAHFECNLDRYRALFRDFVDADEWPHIIAESDPDYVPGPNEAMGLQNIHIFGLANVLRRPVILLDSLSGLQSFGDYSGVFLPVMSSPDACRGKDGKLNKPLCVAWSSSGRNHFIALVGVKGRPLPRLPRWMLMKAWGAPQEAINQYIEFDAQGMCTVGGDRSINEKYVQRLATAMESMFLNKHGVHPSLVADVYNYIYKRTGVVGLHQSVMIERTRQAVLDCQLYRCLICAGVSSVPWPKDYVPPPTEALKKDGKLYNLATKSHETLKEGHLYEFPLPDVYCRYDASIDELVPDLTIKQAATCPFCQGKHLRRVRANGQIVYVNFDRTSTPSMSTTCNCGHKHYFEGQEYDNPPRLFKVPLAWKGNTVEEDVVWFSNESQLELNSNAFKIAEKLVNKHYPGEFGNEQLVQKVVEDILQNTASKEPVFHPPSLTDMRGAAPSCQAGGQEDMDIACSSRVGADSSRRPPGEKSKEGSPRKGDTASAPMQQASKIIMSGNSKSLHKEELTMSETEKSLRKRISENAPDQQHHSVEERTPRTHANKPSVEERAHQSPTNRQSLEERTHMSPTNKPLVEERAMEESQTDITLVEDRTADSKTNEPKQQVTQEVKGHKVVSMETGPPPQTIQPPRDIRIKLCSSDGKQATLVLEQATTYSQLQALIETKLHVPPSRQKIKHGFPPKELRAPPMGEEGTALPLRNGDKLTVEVLPDPNIVRADPHRSGHVTAGIAGNRQKQRAGSSESGLDQGALIREFQKGFERIKEREEDNLEFQLTSHTLMAAVSGKDLWNYSKDKPEFYERGGLFYQIVARDLGLEDGKHCMLPSIPEKRFRFSASADRLELCLEPLGHFPVGPNVGHYEKILAYGQQSDDPGQSSLEMGQRSLEIGESSSHMGQMSDITGQRSLEMGQSSSNAGQISHIMGQRTFGMGQRSLEMSEGDVDIRAEDMPSSSGYVAFAGRGHSLGADGGGTGGSEIAKSGKKKGKKSSSPQQIKSGMSGSVGEEMKIEVQSEQSNIPFGVGHPQNEVDQASNLYRESVGSEHSILDRGIINAPSSSEVIGTTAATDSIDISHIEGNNQTDLHDFRNAQMDTNEQMDTDEKAGTKSLRGGQASPLPMEVDQSDQDEAANSQFSFAEHAERVSYEEDRVGNLQRFHTEPILGMSHASDVSQQVIGTSEHAPSTISRASSEPNSLLHQQGTASTASATIPSNMLGAASSLKGNASSTQQSHADGNSGGSESVIGSNVSQAEESTNEETAYIPRRLGPGYSVLIKKEEDKL